jgi:hypothetical protein
VTEGARKQGQEVGGLSRRAVSWLAWSVCVLVLALLACGIVFAVLNDTAVEVVSFLLALTASAAVGGLVASRRPTNPVGWLFLGSATQAALQTVAAEYATYGLLTSPGALPFAGPLAWFSVWTEPLGVALILVVLPFFFPDGRLVSPGWRPVAWLVVLALVVIVVLRVLEPGVVVYRTARIANPLGVEALEPYLEGHPAIGAAVWLGLILVAVTSLIVRFRNSRGEERQQIKWLALAAAFIPIWFLVNTPIEAAVPGLFFVIDALVVVALIPLAAGIAILRYRLYEIDLIINRTVVYGALTAILVTLYLGGIVVLQKFFVFLTGQQSTLAVVASTLVIAALFNPLRRRIQSFIDRSFYRKKYNARKTLEAFAAKLREETDLDSLSGDLVGVVTETMQPAHVSLWLRPDTAPKGEQAD